MIKRFNDKRYVSVFRSLDDDYATLICNRFAMYTDRDSMVTDREVSLYGGGRGRETTIWVELHDDEFSKRDMEVALGILKKDKRTSGPEWGRFYSEKRQPNEIHY